MKRLRSQDNRCPICGKFEWCFDGLCLGGSAGHCTRCGAELTVVDQVWDSIVGGMLPVFEAAPSPNILPFPFR